MLAQVEPDMAGIVGLVGMELVGPAPASAPVTQPRPPTGKTLP